MSHRTCYAVFSDVYGRVGNLRLQLPQPNLPYSGAFLATAFGPACPQQNINLPLPPGLASETIDMLTNLGVNVAFPFAEDCKIISLWYNKPARGVILR